MHATRDGSRLRSASFHAFWAGAVLLFVGAGFLFVAFPAVVMNMHPQDPNEGMAAFLFGGLCFLVGLLSSIFSLISGIVVWVKDGRSCPWPVRAGFVLLAAIFGTAAFLFGGLWLLVVLLSSIFSLISGIVVWVKYGQSCPRPVLSRFVLLAAVLSWNIIVISAIVRRWL
jgi:hypothetical protein